MFPPIIGVAAGWGHSIAIGQDKGLWVWGHNKDVQLRIRLIKYKPIKIDDQDIIDVTSQVLAAGYYHSLALLKDNMCRCRLMDWGSNYYEQLSDGLQQDSMRPVEIMMTR